MGFIWDASKDDDAKFKKHLKKELGDGLKAQVKTNAGLLGSIAKLKKQVKDKEGVDITEHNRLITENKELKDKEKEGETDAEKALRIAKEQHATDIEKLTKKVDVLEDTNKESLVDSQVTKGLVKARIKPDLINAAQKIIKADVSIIKGDDGKTKAVIGDRSIPEHIKKWAKSDEGKNFVLAKKNKGGNSFGGKKGGGGGKQESFFDRKSDKYNVTKQIQLKNSDPKLYDKLKKKHP